MKEAEFIELARRKYSEIHKLKQAPSLLDYEAGFLSIWQELGESVAQANLGDQGKDKRKKKDKKPPR